MSKIFTDALSGTDKLQLTTSSTAALDVMVEYIDINNTTKAVTPGRQLTKITTATTTDILGTPANGSTRKLKMASIGNLSATTANTVTAIYNSAGTGYTWDSWIIGASERVRLTEARGWEPLDASGRVKIPGLGLSTGNSNVADVVASAAATYLTGGSLLIGGRVQAGSFFKWRLRASKTATGTTAATIAVVTGTLGTSGDTARVTHTSTAIQTAAVDSGMFEIDANFRAVGAGSTVLQSSIRLDHVAADAAGFGTFRYLTANSAAFTLGASDIIGLVVTPGAGVWTFQEVIIDSGNLLS
jgi:hypothetical protein